MLICAGPALVFRTVPVYQIDITFKNGIATPGQVCVIENVQLKKKQKKLHLASSVGTPVLCAL